jgi:predicted metal-dependent hydrolase
MNSAPLAAGRAPKFMQIEIDKLIRSRRRTLAIEVNKKAELIVRAPLRVSERQINAFVWKSRAWIEQTQQEVRGKIEQGAVRRSKDPFDEPWYRDRAAQIIPERVEYYAGQLGLEYTRVRISGAKRIWGSCSAKNSLSFSWRLAMAPMEIIDYIVVHELTHTIHRNHGKLFWRRVGKTIPDHQRRRRWLRNNEHLFSA